MSKSYGRVSCNLRRTADETNVLAYGWQRRLNWFVFWYRQFQIQQWVYCVGALPIDTSWCTIIPLVRRWDSPPHTNDLTRPPAMTTAKKTTKKTNTTTTTTTTATTTATTTTTAATATTTKTTTPRTTTLPCVLSSSRSDWRAFHRCCQPPPTQPTYNICSIHGGAQRLRAFYTALARGVELHIKSQAKPLRKSVDILAIL